MDIAKIAGALTPVILEAVGLSFGLPLGSLIAPAITAAAASNAALPTQEWGWVGSFVEGSALAIGKAQNK